MWDKTAASQGSALPDSTKSTATVLPTTPVAVANKTAPGQTGPKGMSPRTTYSRVNTAPAPTPSLGDQAKATPPRGMEFLPKFAHKENSMTSYAQRPDIQEMVKSALAATANRVNVTTEASRQLGFSPEESKTASAEQDVDHIPTELSEKYAAAIEYIADEQLKEAADPGSAENASPGVGPGQGNNALEVSESNRTEANIDAGQGGQAKDQIPTNPPMAKLPGQPATAANAMATDVDTTHPEQPVDPMGNAHASNAAQKTAAALVQSNLAVLQKLAKVDTGSVKKVEGKEASALALSNLALLHKLAEDAINPAQISGGGATAQGADAPSGVSAAEEGPEPPKPAPANTQAGLVGSNESAINYNKRDAKANMRADMAQLLNEPMQARSGDQVLSRTLDNDGGAKIAAAQLTKTAAAKALLLKLAKEQESEKDAKAKKEKQSQAGGDLSTPSGQSGFSAASSM